jgi:hypothetical protein
MYLILSLYSKYGSQFFGHNLEVLPFSTSISLRNGDSCYLSEKKEKKKEMGILAGLGTCT